MKKYEICNSSTFKKRGEIMCKYKVPNDFKLKSFFISKKPRYFAMFLWWNIIFCVSTSILSAYYVCKSFKTPYNFVAIEKKTRWKPIHTIHTINAWTLPHNYYLSVRRMAPLIYYMEYTLVFHSKRICIL